LGKISALLFGASLGSDRAAAAINNKVRANVKAGASLLPNISDSSDVNTAAVTNNAASANRPTQTGAAKLSREAQANASEAETMRQIDQQRASTGASANTTVPQ